MKIFVVIASEGQRRRMPVWQQVVLWAIIVFMMVLMIAIVDFYVYSP